MFYEWKEGGQNQSPAIKYKSKKHPVQSKVKTHRDKLSLGAEKIAPEVKERDNKGRL